MDNVNDFFATLSSYLWGWPMIVLLLGTHVFLSVRLRFPQRKLFTAIRLSVQRDKSQKGDVSQFGALATALAATIGTGNIIGVATAVALGGPGAVFWCWLTGVFGISTILGWGYYGERAMEYLKGKRWTHVYRLLYILAIFAGSVANLSIVWNIADCMNALMAIPNLLSLIFLNGVIVHETRKYLWRDRLDREMNEF